MASSRPQHLEPSELGTKEYWDTFYDNSLNHYLSRRTDTDNNDKDEDEEEDEEDDDDPGTSWFTEHNAPQKVLDFLTSARFPLSQPSILDLGTGNGSMLALLRDEGTFTGPLVGVDYSPSSVALARRLNRDIRFEVWDILDARHEADIRRGAFGRDLDWYPAGSGGFDVVLDKGTFDAVSLAGGGVCERYPGVARALVRAGGFLVVTSCNWTEGELVEWFTGGTEGRFKVYDRVEYPKFRFGGQEGQGVCTVCFQGI